MIWLGDRVSIKLSWSSKSLRCVFLELDQLYKKLGWSAGQRLQNYKEHKEFYNEQADIVINFCKKNKIEFHIKTGTKTDVDNANLYIG